MTVYGFVNSHLFSVVMLLWFYFELRRFQLMKSLASVGPPVKKPDCSVMLGLVSAVEALCDPTPSQEQALASRAGRNVENKGRIICITQLRKFVEMLVFCSLTLLNYKVFSRWY